VTSVLDVEGITAQLGGREVLTDVSLSLARGEIVGLIGPNGAGKTTLLRVILGLLPAQQGRVLVHGTPAQRHRGAVGYVPQRHEFAWDFPITVAKAVMTGRTHRIGWLSRPSAADRLAVADALTRVGLLELRHRPISELSGGQRQRVLVARALALQPDLLLLDEPFTGIDVPTQQLLTELLRQLSKDGATLLLTTHDHTAATTLCHRICLLNKTIVADAAPDELRDPALWLRAFGVMGEIGERL
jgi:manganese/iron transport system ATP-binding protein